MRYFRGKQGKLCHFAMFCHRNSIGKTLIFYEKMPVPPPTAQDETPGGHIFCTHTPPMHMCTGAGRPSLLSPVWPACSRAPLFCHCAIWVPFIRGEGVAFKDFLGTADYSVGDPLATHVRGLGLDPKYSFFMSSPALLATGWPIS